MNRNKFEKYDILLIIGATILMGALLYYLREILSPLTITVFLILLLLPLRKYHLVKYLIVITSLLFALWVIADASQIFVPFVLSFGLAYLFDPIVAKLERHKIPRWLSVLAIVLFVLALFIVLFILLVPQIISELKGLVTTSVTYSNNMGTWFQSRGADLLSTLRIDSEKVQNFVLTELPGRVHSFLQTFFKSAVNVTSAISSALGQILNLVLMPILFFYLLKDFDKIRSWFRSLLPSETEHIILDYVGQIDTIISGFFRGQLIVCTVVAILTIAGLFALGVEYALVLGLMAGILNIVPYIGLAITLAFGIIVGAFSPAPLMSIIKIIAVIEVVQLIESNLLSPRIVGDRVGLHPVWVIFSILIFSHFLGFVGLIIAVPLTATLKIFVNVGLNSYRQKYLGEHS